MSVGWLCIYFYVRVSKGDKILTLTPDNDHHFISSDKNIFIEPGPGQGGEEGRA